MSSNKPSVTLAVLHSIFLSREQRYALHSGQSLQVIGVQVPVWHEHGFTSEPAVEVFCRYVLHNDPDFGNEILISSWGYEFNLPQPSPGEVAPDIADEVWREMSYEEQQRHYANHPRLPTSKDLLDGKDGGGGRIAFNQRTIERVNGIPVNVLHYVRIEMMETLIESLAS